MAEYTWKDFEQFVVGGGTSSTDPNCWILVKRYAIIDYFKEHPEKLLEDERFKAGGYTVEEIRKILSGEIPGPFLFRHY